MSRETNPFTHEKVTPTGGIRLADNFPDAETTKDGKNVVFLQVQGSGFSGSLLKSIDLSDLEALIEHATKLRAHLAAKIEKEPTLHERIEALALGAVFSLYPTSAKYVRVGPGVVGLRSGTDYTLDQYVGPGDHTHYPEFTVHYEGVK